MCISLLYCVKKKKRVRVYIDRRGDHTWLGKKIISSSSSGLLLNFDDMVRSSTMYTSRPEKTEPFSFCISLRLGFSKNAKPNSPREVSALLSPLNKRKRRRKVRIPAYIYSTLSLWWSSPERSQHRTATHTTPNSKAFFLSAALFSSVFQIFFFFFFFSCSVLCVEPVWIAGKQGPPIMLQPKRNTRREDRW